MRNVVPLPPVPVVPVAGGGQFPIRRIFCVGRNYAAHAAEMGGEVDREAPWYFMKSAHAFAPSGQTLPYPPCTQNFHHEVELVVALGAAGHAVTVTDAPALIWGYGCGLDMTRRDLQQQGKDHRRPWDFGKDIENGAVLGDLVPAAQFGEVGTQDIALHVNGAIRQEGNLSDMVCSVPEIISHLSHFYHLQAGDLIMTGTPSGVGPVVIGDEIVGDITGLPAVRMTIGA